MIYSLDELPNSLIIEVGSLIQDLFVLQRAGVPVSDAIVLSTDEFVRFRNTGSVDSNLIDNIVSRCSSGQFALANQVYIRSTSAISYVGLEDKQIAQKQYTSIRYMIERVYRSWSDDRALASRSTKHIDSEDGYPTLLIEPYFDAISTLVTRNGVTGEPTDESNYARNVNNQVATFTEVHRHMLTEVDNLLRMPTKVSFVDGFLPRVLSISRQPITLRAYQHCLIEYAARGILTPIEYLRRIDPKTIGVLTDYDLVAANVLLTVEGKILSSGWALGPIIFDVDKIRSSIHKPILITRDLPYDDFHAIVDCAGVIGISVGRTSHLAIACMGLGIPALGIEDVHIDYTTRCAVFKSGCTIAEYTYGLINTELKVVRFASDTELEPIYTTQANPDYLDTIHHALSSYDDIGLFRQMSERDQMHLAHIRRRLRLIGRIE